MRIKLTKRDYEFAKKFGMSNKEMIGYIEDMIVEEEMQKISHEIDEQVEKEMSNSPQAIYPAW